MGFAKYTISKQVASEAASEMNREINADFVDMKKKLKFYIDKGQVTGVGRTGREPMTMIKPDPSLIKPLKKVDEFPGRFSAVDCSTRTLKRANNWGIYLMRATYASVKERDVEWGFQERVCTVVGDAHVRRSFLQDFRMELESNLALNLLAEDSDRSKYISDDVRSTYLLLDGGGYFGGDKKFRVSLYEKCEEYGIILLAISKNSPSLHDDRGRDFLATTYNMAPYNTWVYHPVRKADKDKSLYGDITVVKLCADSNHVFRCDVMEYLTNREIDGVLSPLSCISEDPRCVGYPITLLLAHEFSAPSDSMLLFYHDHIEEALKGVDLLDALSREESSCSFADKLHGVKHAYEREWWDGQL